MKKLIPLLAVGLVASCSILDTSFYDDNESLLAIEVRHEVYMLDCSMPYIHGIKTSVDKLYLYTESKGSKDIHELVGKMRESAAGLKEDMSLTFCSLKKTALESQGKSITDAIMGRF